MFDLPAIKGTLKSLLQYHNSKASILWRSAFFMVQLSHPYIYIYMPLCGYMGVHICVCASECILVYTCMCIFTACACWYTCEQYMHVGVCMRMCDKYACVCVCVCIIYWKMGYTCDLCLKYFVKVLKCESVGSLFY